MSNAIEDKPIIHVRIQQIYGKKKVTTISGIEEYKKWLIDNQIGSSNTSKTVAQPDNDLEFKTSKENSHSGSTDNGQPQLDTEHGSTLDQVNDFKQDNQVTENRQDNKAVGIKNVNHSSEINQINQAKQPDPAPNPLPDTDDKKKKKKNKKEQDTALETLLSQLKKKFNCGGHLVKKEGVITLQGEHSYDIKQVLIKMLGKDCRIVVHGMK